MQTVIYNVGAPRACALPSSIARHMYIDNVGPTSRL